MNSKQEAGEATLAGALPMVPPWLLHALAIMALAAGSFALHALSSIRDGYDDPDSLMRLVEVRDYLAGQGWFDLRQVRLMPPDGVVMHWSRLVDWPIAMLIRALTPFLGPEQAELAAINAWPVLLLVPFLAGLGAIAHRFAGWTGAGWTLAFFVLSPAVGSVFEPGRLDHHNVQAVLLVWMIAGLVRAGAGRRWGALAGTMAGASIAVGLEMLAPIVVGIAGLALAWALDGDRYRSAVIGFGAAFAASVGVLFLATVAPDRWSLDSCDAISRVYAVLGLVGGLGLAGIAALLRGGRDGVGGWLVRGGALAALGAVLLWIAALWFPLCLAGPYAGLDPLLKPIWLDEITEAKSIVRLFSEDWTVVALHFVPPSIAAALTVFAALAAPRADRTGLMALAGLIGASILVGAVQIRGIVPAQTVAVAAAAVVTALIWRNAGEDGIRSMVLRAVWIPLSPLFWFLALFGFMDEAAADARARDYDGLAVCRAELGAALQGEAPALVAAPDTLGAYLLMRTPMSVVAAPYHRGGEGILAIDRILTSAPGEDRHLLDRQGARFLALCPTDRALPPVVARAPDGLAARILAGAVPEFLVPLVETPETRLYRIAPRPASEVTGSVAGPGAGAGLRPSLP